MNSCKKTGPIQWVGWCLGLLWFALTTGCQPPDSESASKSEEASVVAAAPDPLKMLLIDAPELGREIARQWRARRNGEITITDQTMERWRADDFEVEADVVVYPAGNLADLVCGGRLLALPGATWDSEQVSRRDILKRSRQDLVAYDDRKWAVPLSNPQWTLLYRADLLEQMNVKVPKTWKQWTDIVKTIRRADLPIETKDRVVLPLAENWAAHVFLMRCASVIRQRGKLSTLFDRTTMKPLIDQIPFVDALDQIRKQFGDADNSMTPSEAYANLSAGKSVMTIAWPTSLDTDRWSETELVAAEQIAVATVPGADTWFDLQAAKWIQRNATDEQRSVSYIGFADLVASVSSGSRNASSALDFLQWLCSKEISSLVLTSCERSGPFRRSHLKSVGRWAGNQLSPDASDSWGESIRQTHSDPVVLMFPQLPGYYDYISVLDQNVRKCLTTGLSARDALNATVIKWEAITERIGRDEQTANLRRVNGL